MAESAHSQTADAHAAGGTRRDFLVITGNALLGIGAVAAAWPLISSMNPARDVLAAGAPIDVDLSSLQPGQQILVLWRSRPIFIVHRTPAELKKLQDPQDISLLRDPDSNVLQQPPYVKNWHRSIKPEYLVLVGICTHLGCIPEFMPQPGGSLGPAWLGGYFCPCHGSRYDLSGRVFSGVPAPYNLPVPPHHFVSGTTVRIGENPTTSPFDFDSIEQI
ncbi:MAG: ubiquinol-cytochrome c reductase iron-sulfur subunit [Alphaproteobacteria bacterium]|nr:ubiquinol-cytochrome c reductase iron-sulfur subunit [Alphaproteobacteria bacterium]